MKLVMDASAFAPIILPDERDTLLPKLDEVVESGGAMVPQHWRIEIGNFLLVAKRQARIGDSDEQFAMAVLDTIIVSTDEDGSGKLMKDTWRLAERHKLTLYDAAYLELALRVDLSLATADRQLIRAAHAESVPLFGR